MSYTCTGWLYVAVSVSIEYCVKSDEFIYNLNTLVVKWVKSDEFTYNLNTRSEVSEIWWVYL